MHINANMHKHAHIHSVQTAYPPAGHLLVSHQLVSPAPGQGGHLPHLTLPHRPPPHCVAETEEHFVSKSYSVFERSNFKDNAQTTFRQWMFLFNLCSKPKVLVSGTASKLKRTISFLLSCQQVFRQANLKSLNKLTGCRLSRCCFI